MAVSDYKCICTGFEGNTVADFYLNKGGIAVSTVATPTLGGSYCLRIDTNSAIDSTWQWAREDGPGGFITAFSVYFKVRINGTPSKQIGTWFQFLNILLDLETSRKITIRDGTNTATSTTALTADTNYEIQILSAPNDKVYLRINGADECNIPYVAHSSYTFNVNGGTDNSAKGGTGYSIYTYVDDLIVLLTRTYGIQTPWIPNTQSVKDIFPEAEATYADSTATGVAHPNAYQNVDDYNNTADWNRLGSTSVIKRDSYKRSTAITIANTFNGFCTIAILKANNSPDGLAPVLIRDNNVDISDGWGTFIGGTSNNNARWFGYYKYRPSDDTVALTKAHLDWSSGANNIEFGLLANVQSGGTMTWDIISQWVSYIDGTAFTTVPFTWKSLTVPRTPIRNLLVTR